MTPAEKLSKKIVTRGWRLSGRCPKSRRLVWTCKLLEKRNALGLSLRDVAAATGVSNPALSHYERGTDLVLSKARKVADFFGCSVEEMWPAIAPAAPDGTAATHRTGGRDE